MSGFIAWQAGQFIITLNQIDTMGPGEAQALPLLGYLRVRWRGVEINTCGIIALWEASGSHCSILTHTTPACSSSINPLSVPGSILTYEPLTLGYTQRALRE